MADTGLRMNFAALKRADPYAREIIDSASHVALYTFEENEWEKTNIEGALFVYSRNGEPYHSLVIMNRLNTNNLIEPVSKGIEMQLKEPFLLYRNAKCCIYGIWFYDKDECIRVATKLNSLVKDSVKMPGDASQNAVYSASPKAIPEANAPVDIFSMLSKAQDYYNSNKGLVPIKSDTTPTRAPDMTSQSVMDFFAKAGSGATAQMPPVSSLPSPGIFGPCPSDSREAPFLLQRLMSNPAHSVANIEKLQRSVTPQDAQCSNGNISLDSAIRQSNSLHLKSTPIDKQSQQRNSKIIQQPEVGEVNGPNPLETELNLMHISSPKPTSPLASYLNQSQDMTNTIGSYNGGKLDEVAMFPIINSLANQPKPALMPPTMFTTTTPSDAPPPPEPLTRNQLLQAFNYLLKHDADFVNRLHEGYVKSFSDKAFSVS